MTTPVVLVDTTTTAKDVMLDGANWQQMLALAKRADIKLYVPEVVVRETARHWSTQVAEQLDLATSLRRLRGRIERLKRLGVRLALDLPDPPDAGPAPSAQHRAALGSRLTAAGAIIPPLPSTSIEEVLERDLDRRRPFQESGKGFRDALVWATVLDVLGEHYDWEDEAHLYFVTDNTTDYWDGDNLHPDLSDDLTGWADVTIVRNLATLLKIDPFAELVRVMAIAERELQEYLQSADEDNEAPPTIAELIADAIATALENLAGEEIETYNSTSFGIDFTAIDVSSTIENPRIVWVKSTDEAPDWQVYENFDDTTLLVQASIGVRVYIAGEVHRSEIVEAEDDGVSISGWDPDEHYCDGETTVLARARFQARVEAGVGVDEVELDGFEPV